MFVGGLELHLCFSEVSISFLSIIVPLLLGCMCGVTRATSFMV
jgi:hypothetical protein